VVWTTHEKYFFDNAKDFNDLQGWVFDSVNTAQKDAV
jgi:hypothetical protein